MKNNPVGLAHIGLPVKDFKTSVEFYNSLGFKEVVMLEESCMLENNGCTMEIYQRHDDLSQKPIGIIDHIAFVSNDIDAAYEEAVSLGYKITTQGIESNDMFAPKSNRYFKISGPDGEELEFAQVK